MDYAVPKKYLFDIEEFYAVAARNTDKCLELIEGEIIEMGKIGDKHAGCVDCLTLLFATQIGKLARLRVQNPVYLSDLSEPIPDLSLLRFREDFYRYSRPTPSDVLLLIEVANTSLKYDRETKMPLYGFYQIPEVWLVNLKANIVTVYREPQQRGYAKQQDFKPGEQLEPHQLSHIKIAVSAIFGL